MTRKQSILWSRPARVASAALAALLIVAGAAFLAGDSAGQADSPAPEAEPPSLISYQGFVTVSGTPHDGAGYLKFAVVDSATGSGTANYWANDGTTSGEPIDYVTLAVSNGLFDVLLGDTSLAGMTQPVAYTVFDATTTYLRVWFSETAGGPYEALEPNQRIGSAAYALRSRRSESADTADAVPWSGITDMPAGFADGVDDTTHPISFFASPSESTWTGTGGGWLPLTVDLELHDDGDQLDGDTYTILADDTGVYRFSCQIAYYNGGYVQVGIAKGGQLLVYNYPGYTRGSSQVEIILRASPYDEFQCQYYATYGTIIYGTYNSIPLTYFTGYRLY